MIYVIGCGCIILKKTFIYECTNLFQVSQLFISGDSSAHCSGITYGIFFLFICLVSPVIITKFIKGKLIASYICQNWNFSLFQIMVQVGLGLPDTDAWYMIETIAERNNVGSKQFVS